jgi:hypothetical protein
MPSRNRRRVRNFTIALLLLGLAAWIVPSYLSAERYRRRIQAGLEQVLHRPVKFGAVSFRLIPRPGFSIEYAEVAEDPDFGPEPFARVDRIDCDLRWHSLWRSRMDFARLHLDHPSFNIVMNSAGQWNVEKLLRQSGVTAPPGPVTDGKLLATAEQLDLTVDDARINFQVGPNKKPFAFTDVQARLQLNPAKRRVQFQVTASPVRSDLSTPTPGPVEASGTWTPGGDLGGPIEARLRTQGALLYDWIPVITGVNPQIYGVMDSDVHLTGSLPDLTVEGETHLAQLQRWETLPPSDSMPMTLRYHARFLRETGRLILENLEASFADSHLHISGSVDKVQSDPQLDLVLALERSRLEDVLAVIRHLWPNPGAWNVKGRFDGMLSIRGPWKKRQYGGFVGAHEVSLETPSGSFPVSEIAVRVNNDGAVLAPVQIALAPRVTLSALGTIDRGDPESRYEVQVAARGVPLRDLVTFGRGLGVHAFQGIDATGSTTGTLHLVGAAWPPARPVLTARVNMRSARLLIPGLTEPLNIPHASLQINDDQITADPVVAVMGTSVFNARLFHNGPRINLWKFDLRANGLRLEEGALWFAALGLRQPLPLLARLPGLASFAARRDAASQIFGSLNAEGRFSTPALSYRGVTLTDFQGDFEVAGRGIRMRTANFRAEGGRGDAEGTVDFTNSPPVLSVKASLAALPLHSLTPHLPARLHEMRGALNATGSFQTHGLAREELTDNLAGQMTLHMKDIFFGDFDPLGTLVRQAHWGKLEPPRGPVMAPSATIQMEILDRRFSVRKTVIELSGANLQFNGTYNWAGTADMNARVDLTHLRRRWLERREGGQSLDRFADIRLVGPLDHLVINPPVGVAPRRGRSGGAVR